MPQAPFQIDPHLTGIHIAYKPREGEFLADIIAPRRMVNAELFEVDFLGTHEMFELHDDRVGRLSKPNEITFSSTRKQYSTEDHGLDSPIPQKDLDNHQVGPTPEAIATEGLATAIMLNREVRVAKAVEDVNNHKTENVETLSGTSQWSDYTNANPMDAILSALDTPLIRPDVAGTSTRAWRIIRQHPKVVEYVKGTGAGSDAQGMISRSQFAEALELSQFLVGQARGKGLPKNISAADTTPPRLWGDHFWMLCADPLAQLLNMNRPTFLLTAQFGTKTAGRIPDPDMGLDGGYRVRAGEKVKEVVISKECSYLFRNVVAAA